MRPRVAFFYSPERFLLGNPQFFFHIWLQECIVRITLHPSDPEPPVHE